MLVHRSLSAFFQFTPRILLYLLALSAVVRQRGIVGGQWSAWTANQVMVEAEAVWKLKVGIALMNFTFSFLRIACWG